MSSRYKNDNIFGSGPHEFIVGRRGRRVVSYSAAFNDATIPGSEQFGEFETRVEVRGRLVASSESSLRGLVDDILAYTDESESAGTLEDGNGAEWDDVKLLNFEVLGDVDRGRVYSLRYTAAFGFLTGG